MRKLAEKMRGFPDPGFTERLRSKVADDILDDIWMTIAETMTEPSLIFHPVMRHIREERTAAE